MKRRLENFDLLPAVWDETAELHRAIWMQIRSALAASEPLNKSECLVLIKLLKRLEGKREARRHLGFTLQRSKHSQRNAEIADDYIEGRAAKQPRAATESAIMRKHKIGPKALQKITDSGEALGRARGRALPRLLAGNPPNNRK
jgi:hypothetical protein